MTLVLSSTIFWNGRNAFWQDQSIVSPAGHFPGLSHANTFHSSTKAAISYHGHPNSDLLRIVSAQTGRHPRPLGQLHARGAQLHTFRGAIDKLLYTHGTAFLLLLVSQKSYKDGQSRRPALHSSVLSHCQLEDLGPQALVSKPCRHSFETDLRKYKTTHREADTARQTVYHCKRK